MKRFYQDVAVVPVEGGFTIELDGKPLRTPAKAPVILPTRALAEAVAAEWRGQGDELSLHAMPLTRLASTAIDLATKRHDAVVSEIAKYAETDLVCYRAEHPPELIARENTVWQPLLDWAILRFDAPLAVTSGIVPRTQSPETLRAFASAVAALDPMTLTALHAMTTACGSIVIGFALLEGRLDARAAFAASQVDETYQIEQWGEDAEAAKRRAALAEDIDAAARFAALLRA
jgi:chaperone required for assembly of F1-ATPase